MSKLFLRLIFLAFSSILILHVPALADEQKANLMNVSGSAKYPVAPDVGELVLGIEADAKNASEAQTKASSIVASFINQLKALGIQSQEIKTIENSLSPIRDYSNNKPPHKIVSYQAVQKVRIRVVGEQRLGLISKAIDAATRNSINRIEAINFSVSPDLLNETRRKAMSLAAEDALNTGKEVLKKLNLNLTKIKDINLNANNYQHAFNALPSYRSKMATYAEASGDAAAAPEISNIMPGEMMVEGNANLILEFSQ